MHVTFNEDCSPCEWFWQKFIDAGLTMRVNGRDCVPTGYQYPSHVVEFKPYDDDGKATGMPFYIHADEIETVLIY